MLILWIIVSLVIAIAAWLAFFMLLNYISGRSHWQEKFVVGTLPEPPPDGFYKRLGLLAWHPARSVARQIV